MTYTTTTTETWSRTHARYVAGKVAADLRQLSQAYGQPSESQINEFLDELTEFLAAGYVERVTYGFTRGGKWIVALRYTADHSGNLTRDDRSGSIPRHVDIQNAHWESFLVYNDKWWQLSDSARQSFKTTVAVKRVPGTEPATNSSWVQDRTYSSAGGGVSRSVIGRSA